MLRKLLKEDVWNLIDRKDMNQINFRDLVLHLLLESDKFVLIDAFQLADDLKFHYKKVLEDVEKYINNGNQNLIQVLKNVNMYYDENIDPLLKRIKTMKNRKKN